jgi:hypothetical protein
MIAWTTKTFKDLPTISDHGALPIPNTLTATTANDGTWLQDFKNLISTLELTSHSITSLLAILSGALITGRPLPPYLRVPERFHIGEMLSSLDADILKVKHVCETGYSAFAVMQVSTTMLNEDLADLLRDVKRLVGEAEFHLDVVERDYERSVGLVTPQGNGALGATQEMREKSD